ncbi:MAG: hypothetical protein E7082_07335 [Bacteroidales bacterium]|nr:hypothetical protein [Bacteroidales bacterium]
MEADTLKSLYIQEHLERGFQKIFQKQLEIANELIYHNSSKKSRHSGTLREALENPTYFIKATNHGFNVEARWPIYIRFLDMKKHGNYRIYNRQVWGILYKETFKNMRFEFSDWLHDFTQKTLKHAVQPLNQ